MDHFDDCLGLVFPFPFIFKSVYKVHVHTIPRQTTFEMSVIHELGYVTRDAKQGTKNAIIASCYLVRLYIS